MLAYPLKWPETYDRAKARRKSQFKTPSLARAKNELIFELTKHGADRVVITTNIKLRKADGVPFSSAQPTDPGVAVYFTMRLTRSALVIPCDKWNSVEDNIWAIAKTINALRGIERWGSGDLVERAFVGFNQLQPARKKKWFEILGIPEREMNSIPFTEVRRIRNEMLFRNHPDKGGSTEHAAEINRAWDEFNQERNT